MKPVTNKKFYLELPTALPKSAAQLMSVCVMSAALAACGGSSGGTSGGEMDGGSDPQGILDPNIDPTIDPSSDTDGDGLTYEQEIALATDPTLWDTDGDGLSDEEENRIGTDPTVDNPDDFAGDLDNDTYANYEELDAGSDPLDPNSTPVGIDLTDPDPVVADRCDDPNSSNASWNDNCQLRRYGTYANSLYTRGIQRILHCQGYGSELTIEAYSDGKLGENTDLDIKAFQAANGLADDGIIGRQTWGALFSKLTIISDTEVEIGGTSYTEWSIDGCDQFTAQFYQEVTTFEVLGWKMASTPGSTILVDFSSEAVD